MEAHEIPSFAAVEQAIVDRASDVARDIITNSRESQASTATQTDTVASRIEETWCHGWELFDACIFAAQQNSLLLLRRGAQVRDGHSPKRDALTLLHCAAVLQLLEIRQLLRVGLWAGAAARWRSLHEVAVTAKIVARHSVSTAERYIDHAFIVQTRRLGEYQDRYGVGPVAKEELDERRRRVTESLQKYADPAEAPFGEPYGWAADLMPLTRKGDKRQRPTLERLEQMAGLDDLRLLVFSVHGLVHSDSAGVVTSVLAGEPGDWILGPQTRHVETVAKPTMVTIQHVVAAVHGGFECEAGKFTDLLALLGVALVRIASWAVEAFEANGMP